MNRVWNGLVALGAFSIAYTVLHPPLRKFDIAILVLFFVTYGVGHALEAVVGHEI